MEDFFKQFRRNLERRPAPVFEEQDWQDMEKRLDKQDKKRRKIIAAGWWTFPLLALSLGANLFFVRTLNNIRHAVSRPDMSRDTIYLTQVVFKTDTIYKTQTVRLKEQMGFANLVPTNVLQIQPTDLKGTDKNDNYVSEKRVGHSKNGLKTKDNQIVIAQPNTSPIRPSIEDSSNAAPDLKTEISTVQIPVFADTATVNMTDLTRPKTRNNLFTYWNYLKPEDFQFGVTGGWAVPSGGKLDWQSGISAGIYAALVFSTHMRLWADVQYLDLGFTSNRMDNAIGIPPITPPSDDFLFLKADAPQPALQYTAGLSYYFKPGRRFNPFMGLGYAFVSRLPYEIVYEFEKKGTGIEWTVDKQINQRAFFSDYGLLAGGFEQQLSKYWNFQLRANYRRGFGKSKNYMPQLIGLQGVLIRTF